MLNNNTFFKITVDKRQELYYGNPVAYKERSPDKKIKVLNGILQDKVELPDIGDKSFQKVKNPDDYNQESLNWYLKGFWFARLMMDYYEDMKEFNKNPSKKIIKKAVERYRVLPTYLDYIKTLPIIQQALMIKPEVWFLLLVKGYQPIENLSHLRELKDMHYRFLTFIPFSLYKQLLDENQSVKPIFYNRAVPLNYTFHTLNYLTFKKEYDYKNRLQYSPKWRKTRYFYDVCLEKLGNAVLTVKNKEKAKTMTKEQYKNYLYGNAPRNFEYAPKVKINDRTNQWLTQITYQNIVEYVLKPYKKNDKEFIKEKIENYFDIIKEKINNTNRPCPDKQVLIDIKKVKNDWMDKVENVNRITSLIKEYKTKEITRIYSDALEQKMRYTAQTQLKNIEI